MQSKSQKAEISDTSGAPGVSVPLFSREHVISLPTSELRAIDRSTNPSGRYWMHLAWARTELARRGERAADELTSYIDTQDAMRGALKVSLCELSACANQLTDLGRNVPPNGSVNRAIVNARAALASSREVRS